MIGKYEKTVRELTFSFFTALENVNTVNTSAGVLDFIFRRHPELSLKDTMDILEDAKNILLQLNRL